jgi:hypothetical protein
VTERTIGDGPGEVDETLEARLEDLMEDLCVAYNRAGIARTMSRDATDPEGWERDRVADEQFIVRRLAEVRERCGQLIDAVEAGELRMDRITSQATAVFEPAPERGAGVYVARFPDGSQVVKTVEAGSGELPLTAMRLEVREEDE